MRYHLFGKMVRFMSPVAFLLIALFAIAGCQNGLYFGPSALKTPQGVVADAFLPKDTFIVMKLGSSEKNQYEMLDRILDRFPTAASEDFKKSVVESFDQELAKYQMTFENDLKPVIGDHFQMLVSFGMKSTDPEISVITTAQNTALQVGLVVQVADHAKAESFLNRLAENNVFKKETYGNHTLYYDERGGGYAALVKDALYVAGNLEDVKAGLDRFAAFEKNPSSQESTALVQDPIYQKSIAKIPASLGFAYIDLEPFFDLITNKLTPPQESQELLDQMTGGKEILDAFQSETFGISAEDKGFRIFGSVFGDEEAMKKADFNFAMFGKHDPYLYQKLPADNAMVYAEANGLKQMLEFDFKIWNKIPEMKSALDSMKQFFQEAGLDFDNDVMALLDKGFAFVLQDTGGLIPSIGFYTDASSHPEAAAKTMEVLHQFIQQLMILGNQQVAALAEESENALASDLFLHEDSMVSGGKSHTIQLNADELAKTATASTPIPAPMLALLKDLQLWYGVTGDNILFVTLYPAFDKAFGTHTLAQNENFKVTKAQLRESDNGFTYISPDTLATYLDKIMALVPLITGEESAGEYSTIRDYLTPIKGVIFGSKSSTTEATVDGFMYIPEMPK